MAGASWVRVFIPEGIGHGLKGVGIDIVHFEQTTTTRTEFTMVVTQSVRFSDANAKIERLENVESLRPYLGNGKEIYSFDLISGYSCPFANECLSKAVKNANGKRTIQDGKNTKTRCFSASQEVQYTNVYNLRLGNFEALKGLETADEMADMIESELPDDAGIVRIHVAGDFFNQRYLKANFFIKTCFGKVSIP